MAHLRTSLHTLAIEYGRCTRPKANFEDRYCLFCPHMLEDEKYFLAECIENKTEMDILFSKVERLFKNFSCLDIGEKCIFFLNSKDQQVLTWVAKFKYMIHLKQKIKSWFNYVTVCNSLVQCRQIFIINQYICVDVRMCVDTCVSICMYAGIYPFVHVYL